MLSITTVVSRDFARMYVKLLKDGAADIPLAPEEAEAVEQARGSGPFAIRPRIEMANGSSVAKSAEEAAVVGLDAPVSVGLPGRRPPNDRELTRENRRRKREGLAPLEDVVDPLRYRLGRAANARSSDAEHFALCRDRAEDGR